MITILKILTVMWTLTTVIHHAIGAITVRNPQGENETLTCYGCTSSDTSSCNYPIKLDMTILMLGCRTADNRELKRIRNPYYQYAGKFYHPKKSQSASLWAEMIFKNWDPAPSQEDRLWGLKISVWLDDGSGEQQLESMQKHAHERSKSLITLARKSRELPIFRSENVAPDNSTLEGEIRYYCYVLTDQEKTLRGCSPKPMNKSSACPELLKIHGPAYTCSLCRWSLCNCSIGQSVSSRLVICFTLITLFFRPFNEL